MKSKLLWFILALVISLPTIAADSELEARIIAIEDLIAIEKIVQGDYPRALDEMDMSAYAALWAEDGILIIPSLATLRGPSDIERFLSTPGIFDEESEQGAQPAEPSPPPNPYQVPHMIGSLDYEVDGDTARGSSYWTETTLVDGNPAVVGSGRYLDELKKINGVWKFTKRIIVRDVPVMTPEEFSYAPEISFD